MSRKEPRYREAWTDTEREAISGTLAGIDSALLGLSAAVSRSLPESVRSVANAECYLLMAAAGLRGCVKSAVARMVGSSGRLESPQHRPCQSRSYPPGGLPHIVKAFRYSTGRPFKGET
jgi:hypothetical protein